jgi:hypothetical protein
MFGSHRGRPRGTLSGAAMAEETRRVEATLAKLQSESSRVRAFVATVGIVGVNGVSPPRVRRWEASSPPSRDALADIAARGGAVQGTRGLLMRAEARKSALRALPPSPERAGGALSVVRDAGNASASAAAAQKTFRGVSAPPRSPAPQLCGGVTLASRLRGAAGSGLSAVAAMRAPAPAMISTDHGLAPHRSPTKEAGGGVHWSHLPPLTRDVDGAVASSAVPPFAGEYDEAAEARAFSEAVLAWRRGRAPAEASAPPPRAAPAATSADDWVNPFDNDFSAESADPSRSASGGGGRLLDGAVDEAAEAAAFAEAVRAWRSGSTSTASSVAAATTSAAVEATHSTRTACYECLKLFPGDGFTAKRSGTTLRNGLRPSFCSETCFSAHAALTFKRDALLLSARAELPPGVELAEPPADAPSAIFDIFSFAEAAGASLVLPSSTSVVSSPSPPSPASPPRVDCSLTEEDLTNLSLAAEEAAINI